MRGFAALLLVAGIVCCAHAAIDPCMYRGKFFVRDFFAGSPPSVTFNEFWTNTSAATFGLEAASAFIWPHEYPIAHHAYTNEIGAYHVAAYLRSPFFYPDWELFEDITYLWDKHPEWLEKMPPHAVEGSKRLDGSYVGVPLGGDSYVLWYNKTRMAEWGVTLPTTWAEMLEICDSLVAAGHTQYCLRFSAWYPYYDPAYWFDVVSSRLHGYEWHMSMLAGQESFLDPRFQETLDFLQGMVDSGHLHTGLDIEMGLACFIRGDCPFMITSGLVADAMPAVGVDAEAFETHLDVMRVPPIKAGVESGEAIIGTYYSIPKNSQNKNASESFLELTMSTEGQKLYFDNTGLTSFSGQYNYSSRPLMVKMLSILEEAEMIFSTSETGFSIPAVTELFMDTINAWTEDQNCGCFEGFARGLETRRQEALLSEVAMPVSDPEPGDYQDRVEIRLTTSTVGAVVHYTLDGTVPYSGSLSFSPDAPIVLQTAGTYVIRAVALKRGLTQSEYFQGQFVVVQTAQSASSAEMSKAALGGVLGGASLCLLCVILPVALVIYRKVQSRRISYSIGGEAPLLVSYDQLDFVRSIGMGSFGEVWLARWRGSDVAVKKTLALDVTPELVETFLEETALVMHLRHRNIVTFMGVSTEPLCLVTEFMHRGSLYDVIHNEAIVLEPTTVYHWAHEIAQGMAFLHSADPPVLHRDFKSLNVLMDRNWVPKIADFGLSTMRDVTGASATNVKSSRKKGKKKKKKAAQSAGSISRFSSAGTSLSGISSSLSMTTGTMAGGSGAQGSLYWTAPEVLANPLAFEARSDVYAYGITLWEIFSRAELYGAGNTFAVALGVLQENRRPEIHAIPRDRTALVPLMEDCWAQDVSARPLFSDVITRIREAKLYEPDEVATPEIQSEPTGRVVTMAMTLPDVLDGMNECPEEYAEALTAMHEIITEALTRVGGYLWLHEPTLVLASFHNDAHWARFAEGFVDDLRSVEWSPGLLETRVGRDGVRWSAAVTIGVADSTRDAATYTCTYSGDSIDAARAMAAYTDLTNAFAVDPDLAKALLRSANLRHLSGAPEPCQGPNGDPWTILENVSHATEQQLSCSSSSCSSADARPQPSQWPKRRRRSRGSRDSRGGNTRTSGEHASRKRTSHNARSSKKSSQHPRSQDSWILDATAVTNALAEAERFRVGTYCEVLIGTWHGQDVVFKKLLRQKVSMEEQIKFLLEVALTRRLDHPRLLPIVGVCLATGQRLFVVPYCANGSIADFFGYDQALSLSASQSSMQTSQSGRGRRGFTRGARSSGLSSLPQKLRLDVVTQIVEGIQYLHDNNLAFGSLKPNNIVIGGDNKVFLTDYGLNGQKNLGTMTQTATATYDAPECLCGDPKSPAADIFSLGTLIFEILGNQLFPRGRNSLETAMRLINGDLPPLPPTLAEPIAEIIQNCWARNPDDRPDAASVLRSLNTSS